MIKIDGLIDSFSNRLNKAMQLRNIKATELSTKTGIAKSSLSEYINGKYEAKQDGVYLLAKALNISEAWLMGLDVPMERSNEIKNIDTNIKLLPVPILGRVPAGEPLLAEENIEGYLPIDPSMYGISTSDDFFFLRVAGESMNKIVKNGSYVLVKKQDYAENDDVIVAIVNRR